MVTSERRDPVHGSGNQYEQLTYTYNTPPDWAYTGQWGFSEYDSGQCKTGWGCNHWSDYRGHRQVTVTDRVGHQTEVRFFTGMYDDRYSIANTGRLGDVTPTGAAIVTDPAGVVRNNEGWLVGSPLGSIEKTSTGAVMTKAVSYASATVSTSAYPTSVRMTDSTSINQIWDSTSNTMDGSRTVVSVYDTMARLARVDDYGSTAAGTKQRRSPVTSPTAPIGSCRSRTWFRPVPA